MRSTDSRQRHAGLAADQLPRLLPADSRAEPPGLAEHLARYGPLRPAGLDRRRREALIEEVDRSGLTGRGGAGFPAAKKLAAVAAGHAPIVVANGTEGEPASSKDKVLLARSPQLVLDGAVLAAEIVGASRAVVVVHHSVREIVDAAAAERGQAGMDRIRIQVMTAADRFVAGEASAVVHWIEDGTSHSHQEAAPALGTRARRKADTSAQRRDPGTPRAHRPLRRFVVPCGRHAAGTRIDAGHHSGSSEPAMRARDRDRHFRAGGTQPGRRRVRAAAGAAARWLLR